MPALLPESILKYMIELARGQVKKESLRYRINLENLPLDLDQDSLWSWIDTSEPYPAWLLDGVEADKMLRRQYQGRVNDNLTVPRVLQLYLAESTPVRRRRGRPIDRACEFENVKLRASLDLMKRFMKYEEALERVAEEHGMTRNAYGMTRNALNMRIYPRKRR